jgi:hypothetical protein
LLSFLVIDSAEVGGAGGRQAPLPHLIVTFGAHIAATCLKSRSQRNYEFATDTAASSEIRSRDIIVVGHKRTPECRCSLHRCLSASPSALEPAL